jgi:hypothetical protein
MLTLRARRDTTPHGSARGGRLGDESHAARLPSVRPAGKVDCGDADVIRQFTAWRETSRPAFEKAPEMPQPFKLLCCPEANPEFQTSCGKGRQRLDQAGLSLPTLWRNTRMQWITRLVSVWGLLVGIAPSAQAESLWERVEIDPQFWAEGVAAADFNNDGLMDVAAGDGWYRAPDWKRLPVRQPLDRQGQPTEKYDGSKGYSNTFASWAHDINQDGWQDLILVGYPGAPFYWYENPGVDGHSSGQLWAQHEIWHSICNETPLFTDLTGDGKPELLFGSQPERQMGYVTLPEPARCKEKWTFTAISEAGEPNENGTFMYYHGLGTGDLNRDGRTDVIIPHGWWEGPADHDGSLWTFHPLPLTKPGEQQPVKASNIYVLDLDFDGDQDLILSSAHAYGIWWFENPGKPTEPFAYHLIDESFSQTHALGLVDLYGTGTPHLVTGKRYFAHMGPDPGEFDPVVMYAIEIARSPGQPPSFQLHELVAGKDTGVGTQFQLADLNLDGRVDVVLSNKKGVNLLLQKAAP